MAAKQQTIELPTAKFRGLVLNPSLINVDRNAATLCSNVDKLSDGKLTTRLGTQEQFRFTNSDSRNILFPFTYTYHDVETGGTQEELLCLKMGMDGSDVKTDVTLYKLTLNTLTITYVGAGTGTITVQSLTTLENASGSDDNIKYWKVTATANGSTVYTSSLFDTSMYGTSRLFSTFVSEIHALADFNCSPTSVSTGISGGSTHIDFFAYNFSASLTNGQTVEIPYYSLTSIGNGHNPASAPPLVYTDANFIQPSAYNYSNVIYFAYGTYEHKYDGQDFYRSGLPQATISAIADAAGGTSHPIGDTYIYKLVYSRVDAKGNIIDGEDSDDTLAVATHTMAATRDIDITINNLRASLYPNYALKGAQVNGAQAGVTTITVDAGFTLAVGDTAYFYDGVSASYVSREVTAVAATTITIEGSAVNVADNLIISNNVRIQIWRTKTDAVDFYFVAEIPNDYANTTQVYTDSIADASLTELYTEQLRKHTTPPKCYFVGEHQGLRILAGDPDNPNRLYWALPDDIEGFPIESNYIDVKGGGLGALTGFGTVDDDVLAAFKETGHVLVDGSLDDLNFRVLNRSNTGIGCTSFKTLTNIGEDNALVGVSLQGPFIFNNRAPSLAFGDAIRPLFDNPPARQTNSDVIPNANWLDLLLGDDLDQSIPFSLSRATAINDSIARKYHLFLPVEVGEPGDNKQCYYVGSKYLVFDYDKEHLSWTEISFADRYRDVGAFVRTLNRNAYGGFALYDNEVWFVSCNSISEGSLAPHLCKYNTPANENTDYLDAGWPVYLDIHYVPITRDEGSPSAFFKPLFILLHRYLKTLLDDPFVAADFGDNFSLDIRSVLDYKHYTDSGYSTNAIRTFIVANGNTVLRTKCVTTKCRACQIQVTNENSASATHVPPSFDLVEFIYSTPYDKQSKETKHSG